MNKPFKREVAPLPLPTGNLFRRMITARAIASLTRSSPEEVAAERWPSDQLLSAAFVVRAVSNPAMVGVTGWAAELAHKLVADTVEALGAASGAVDVMSYGLVLNWGGYGSISVPAFVASAANSGFVADGDPIPVRQFVETPQTIIPHKVASISVLTREMMESSNAEQLIGDVLVRSAALAIDAAFFDANAATAARPAGIRNGIAALPPSTSTDSFGGYFEDLASLVSAVSTVGGSGPYIVAGNPALVIGMSARFIGDNDTVLVPVMSAALGNDLIAIAPQAIAAAFSPDPQIETANAGTLVMDTAPGPAGVAGPERSLFQTESFAVKVRWPVSWVLRDPRGVAWLTPSWK